MSDEDVDVPFARPEQPLRRGWTTGSCATAAMLLGEAAPKFLEGQGVRWIGVTSEGHLRGDVPPA